MSKSLGMDGRDIFKLEGKVNINTVSGHSVYHLKFQEKEDSPNFSSVSVSRFMEQSNEYGDIIATNLFPKVINTFGVQPQASISKNERAKKDRSNRIGVAVPKISKK